MRNPDETHKQLRLLRNLGVRVALDDFASGPCSLAHLRDLELDTLKLDRHLIARLPNSPPDAALAASVIDLCRHFGFRVLSQVVDPPYQYQLFKSYARRYGHCVLCLFLSRL